MKEPAELLARDDLVHGADKGFDLLFRGEPAGTYPDGSGRVGADGRWAPGAQCRPVLTSISNSWSRVNPIMEGSIPSTVKETMPPRSFSGRRSMEANISHTP